MNSNDCYDRPNIETGSFYYICDKNGYPLCHTKFSDSEQAKKHYMKSIRKIPGGVYIAYRKSEILQDSFMDK